MRMFRFPNQPGERVSVLQPKPSAIEAVGLGSRCCCRLLRMDQETGRFRVSTVAIRM